MRATFVGPRALVPVNARASATVVVVVALVAAVTVSAVCAFGVPLIVLTTRVWTPGVVPTGTITVNW